MVSPVYFAGPPAQLKALLDRLQPYFWSDARAGAKRPAVLHVVGEGGDPHGFEPLVGIVRSALACAGFTLETVYDWVGKIDENGQITAEDRRARRRLRGTAPCLSLLRLRLRPPRVPCWKPMAWPPRRRSARISW